MVKRESPGVGVQIPDLPLTWLYRLEKITYPHWVCFHICQVDIIVLVRLWSYWELNCVNACKVPCTMLGKC